MAAEEVAPVPLAQAGDPRVVEQGDPVLAVQASVRAVWYAQELGLRQALDVGKTLVQLGTDQDSIAEGQRAFTAGRRVDWRLR